MNAKKVDIAVIGGGPAGLAAAVQAKKMGAKSVCIIERDCELGGILQQCIHDGFGLKRFGKQMSGPQYAEEFIREAEQWGVEILLKTMVLRITEDRQIYAVGSASGALLLDCGAIILTMGCRERTRNQVFIPGSRPSGVMTAGLVQRYINMEGYLPGQKAVILGSGDIGLIMARRMTLEHIEVEGVYEVMPTPGGLTRNIVQCLEDYGIPLHLSSTVTRIFGNERVTGVEIAAVDAHMKPIPGTERQIDCDLLVLAVGLIPENELSKAIGIEMDPQTNGPVVNEMFMTSCPGIFAAGNVVAVFDLVDYVSDTGEMAAEGAVQYIRENGASAQEQIAVKAGKDIRLVVPQLISAGSREKDIKLFLRAGKTARQQYIKLSDCEKKIDAQKESFIAPPEMIVAELNKDVVIQGTLTLSLEEVE